MSTPGIKERAAEELGALRPWARKGGGKERKAGGVIREEKALLSSPLIIFDDRGEKKFILITQRLQYPFPPSPLLTAFQARSSN